MKLGVLTVLFQGRPWEEVLDDLAAEGVQAVEVGTGGYAGTAHCDPDSLLGRRRALNAYRGSVESRGMVISALSCHGNPLHPNHELAERYNRDYRQTVELAEELGVGVVNLFSGCPGDSETARYPNWVTCAWPTEYSELLAWQWEQKVIPYWHDAGRFAEEHGIRLAFEMHPGFVVYNPETLLRLRQAIGSVIGANYDPSHLFWQGIDPVASIRALSGAIHHVHAKDTALDPHNVAINGVLDTKPYADVANRSWTFRTVGYGHDQLLWRDIISALRVAGYDYVLSIEHEDPLASIDEGFKKAVHFLKEALLTEQPSGMWWA